MIRRSAESAFGTNIRVIRRTSNGGYAAGANTGWRATDAPIIAVFNQCLTFESDCLEQMRRVLIDEKREALVTPKIVLKADPTVVNAIGNDVHLSGVAWCHGLGSPADDWRGVTEVTAIAGTAFMVRRAFLERLGGLEEAYFMYMEDVDLSLRARLAGAVCLAACDATVVNAWSLALTPWKFGLLERNRRALWERFIAPSGAHLWLVLLQAEIMAWVYAAHRGRRHLKAKWRAYRTPLALDRAGSGLDQLFPWLSRRHPYDVLFRGSKLVVAAGGFVDTLVERSLGVRSSTHPARHSPIGAPTGDGPPKMVRRPTAPATDVHHRRAGTSQALREEAP